MIAGYQRKKVVKKRVIASLSLLERDYTPCRTCPLIGTHEREAFSGSLEVASADDNEPWQESQVR